MKKKIIIIKIIIIILIQIIIKITAVQRSTNKDNKIKNQIYHWYLGDIYHFCKYNQSDYSYFMSLCSKNWKPPGLSKRIVYGTRQEYRCLTTNQRNSYHAALNTMKRTRVGEQTEYDGLVVLHDGRSSPSAHFSPGFGAWHRVYLVAWERAIRNHCPSCMIPYWDSRLDRFLGGNPADSVLFSPFLAGNANGPVTSGFPANWQSSGTACRRIGRTLMRDFDSNVFSFYDDSDVNFVSTITSPYQISYPWDDRFEFSHGYVHTAFGTRSHMTDILCSPTDPLFILHHSFVDNLLERARVRLRSINRLFYPDVTNLPNGFSDINNNIRRFSAATESIRPFTDGSDHVTAFITDDYTENFYDYQRSPGDVTCTQDNQCCQNGNTEFVWCNVNTRRCVSKAREGGRVNVNYPNNACHCDTGRSVNRNGVCVCER